MREKRLKNSQNYCLGWFLHDLKSLKTIKYSGLVENTIESSLLEKSL